jgi:hypothetical protein
MHHPGAYRRPADRHRLAPIRSLVVALTVGSGLILAGCVAPSGGDGALHKAAAPTPTSTVQGQLAHRVDVNVWHLGVQSLETTYDAQRDTAGVTITLGGTTPNTSVKVSAAQELTKAFCLMAEQTLWTSGATLDEVTVTVQGSYQDPYSGLVIAAYGVATVEAPTAHRIPWASIGADAAWQAYDHVFLREIFETIDQP